MSPKRKLEAEFYKSIEARIQEAMEATIITCSTMIYMSGLLLSRFPNLFDLQTNSLHNLLPLRIKFPYLLSFHLNFVKKWLSLRSLRPLLSCPFVSRLQQPRHDNAYRPGTQPHPVAVVDEKCAVVSRTE
jgi:hypothetical protein